MKIGKLTERVTPQKPVTTADGMGGSSLSWQNQMTVWATFKKPRMQTVERNGTIASELFREITIRKQAVIRKGWRVLWGNRVFSVEHTYDGDDEDTVLVCREVII